VASHAVITAIDAASPDTLPEIARIPNLRDSLVVEAATASAAESSVTSLEIAQAPRCLETDLAHPALVTASSVASQVISPEIALLQPNH